MNFSVAGLGLVDSSVPGRLDVTSVSFSGNRYWLLPTVPAASLLMDYDQGLYIRRYDRFGTFMPQWNASVTPMSLQR